jgi:long-chain acyl-CoA synthetase
MKKRNAVGMRNGFESIDFLQAALFMEDEWTPESWLVTAAQNI